MKIFFHVFILTMGVSFNAVMAAEVQSDSENEVPLGLTHHEPNLLGVTYDNDDREPFLDFKLSLDYPLAHGPLKTLTKKSWYPSFIKKACNNGYIDHCYPYFSFTGRFGQYIGQRDSSPVIAKRFNPKLFLRFELKNADHFDLEYAHESNGQRISTQASYDTLATDLDSKDMGKREHANDYISRGWDYYGFTYKHTFAIKDKNAAIKKVVTYLNVRKFIGGLLQGDIEEYYDWETRRDITSRSQVNGVRVLAKVKDDLDAIFWGINKVAVIYETGTESPMKYNTVTLEMTTNILDVPLMFWGRAGYNSDLAQYYKKVNSIGVAFELETLSL